MKRIDKVYQFVKEKTKDFTPQEIDQGYGITTKDVAEYLGVQRSNVSKDLNRLVREGKLSKFDGRPVKYVDIATMRHKPFSKYVPSYKEQTSQHDAPFGSSVLDYSFSNDQDIFQTIIGTNGSMKNAVEQAKAAILYPPDGLNTLITGPTGSGKSFFAHAMFRFAQANDCISDEKELIVFNCADYAHNPELLMSHLFGYVKGAFTGATVDKEGLIQQADGGMLFLDEIHRLPPEGQEMIFYFMDYGSYSRLGETVKTRSADVRIIGATTEDPGSTLLDTFMRRIPINIQLPSFQQRPVSEKIDLVKVMTGLEANRIQRKISLKEDVVKALVASVGYGNIGQLKSNIQLVCARGFMHQMQKEEIELTVNDLPEGIKSGLVKLSSERKMQAEMARYLEPKMIVSPNEPFIRMKMDAYELPYNLYDIIGDKAELLKAEGLDQESINHYISTDINVHLKSFYRNHGFSFNTESKLSEFVDKDIIQLTHELYDLVRDRLGESFQQNFIYAVSLHISSFLKKLHLGEERHTNTNIREMAVDFPEEYEVAKEIQSKIETDLHVAIPNSEVYYLTVLLVSLREKEASGAIGIVVAAHGNHTASSMTHVVEELLGVEAIPAIDMPLDMPPRTAYERLEQAVKQADEGRGVLLLVDMGSLATFDEELQEKTGIAVRTIDMVTTALVLEAVRKSSMIDTELDDLYSVLKKFRGYVEPMKARLSRWKELEKKEQAILAICASGEGTAKRIKEMIEDSLKEDVDQNLTVIACSVSDLDTQIQTIKERYSIVATTGIMDPKLAAPFIPLEQFIEQDIDVLIEKIRENTINKELEEEMDEEGAQEICVSFMEESFTFLNPKKMIIPLWNFAKKALNLSGEIDKSFASNINLVLHMAGVMERSVLNDTLTVDQESLEQMNQHELFSDLKILIDELEEQVKVSIPLNEYVYLFHYLEGKLVEKDEIDELIE
jgi:transcriptional regulatory protein LevR/transcriptional regulator with AAA-type ATPase domain